MGIWGGNDFLWPVLSEKQKSDGLHSLEEKEHRLVLVVPEDI